MTGDHPIVSEMHALLRPGLTIDDAAIDAAHMAVLRGEITVAEFAAAHGAAAGEWLVREVGEVGRG